MEENKYNISFSEDDCPITRDMLIEEIVSIWPETEEVLASFGMQCVGCAAAEMETLSEACGVHHLNVNKVMRALNAAVMGEEEE